MKIFNWSHPNEFSNLIESLSHTEGDDKVVIQISRKSQAWWYHIALLARLYSQKNIIFVCRDQRLRSLLKQYGFVSYSSIQSVSDVIPEWAYILQENLWPLEYVRFVIMRFLTRSLSWIKEKTPKKKPDIFTVRHSSWYVLMLGIVVVLLLIIGIVSLTSPHATIMISPQITLQNAIGNIVFMSEDALSADTQVPLRKQIFPFEIQKKYTVSTYDATKVHRAAGKISITNTRSEPLRLKPQTRVVFEDVVFRTAWWIEVPAAADSTPGEFTVNVIADALSTAGPIWAKANIPANTPLTFPWLTSDIHEGIFVKSIEDFKGWEDTFYPLLTEDEKKRLEALFREHFLAEAQASIQKNFNQDADFIPVPLPEAIVPFEVTVQADQTVGSTSPEITFTGKGDFLLYLYDKNHLRKILIKLAQSHLLRWVESYTDTFKPPVIVSVLSQSKDPDPFSIKATAQIEIQVLYDFESTAGRKTLQNILSDVLWAEKERVEKTLLNHPYIKDVHIRLTPFWSRKLPSTLDAIDIQVEK